MSSISQFVFEFHINIFLIKAFLKISNRKYKSVIPFIKVIFCLTMYVQSKPVFHHSFQEILLRKTDEN